MAVEVNSETDFVARNSDFQAIVRAIAEVATGCADIEALRGAQLGDKTVEEAVTEKITTIGENLHLRRMVAVEGESVASYVHNAVAEGLGKIGVLVALKGARQRHRQADRHARGGDGAGVAVARPTSTRR